MKLRKRSFEQIEVDTHKMTEKEALKLIPRKLYKYYPINEFTFKVLTEQAIYFSKPSGFSDPFDCKLNINFGKSTIQINENLNHYFPQLVPLLDKTDIFNGSFKTTKEINQFLNTLVLSILDMQMGVTCFSEVRDSPLMWAHYAHSHSGICLEFDMKTPSFFRDNLIPVMYFDKYPVYSMEEYKSNGLGNLLTRMMASKSEDWDYEFEWRCTTEKGGAKTYSFDKALVTGIIFGINCPEDQKTKILEILQDLNYCNCIPYQADMNSSKFKIDIVRY
ncbi:DUF2971 domain-containing protein [Lacihabitans soyangensis]|uniref:DUF2971 domain-containing protein n=1 Tax=Lacihabitans soyangensis TaxID=869394 RepID=A0AAE3H7Q9_9BACT|nr:DUF2971 domain-containing protein [Lacihabitans soyangensis]MCP9765671.1 DUF2971 domain-containing protein [Lacihabitans soyangensis]